MQDGKRGLGAAAVFIARNRFAVLEKASNQLVIKNLNNETTKQCAAPPGAPTDAIFYAGTGALLCRSEDKARACFAFPLSLFPVRPSCGTPADALLGGPAGSKTHRVPENRTSAVYATCLYRAAECDSVSASRLRASDATLLPCPEVSRMHCAPHQ